MRELADLGGTEFGNAREKAQPQIFGTDIGQERAVQRAVLRSHRTNQQPFAALSRCVQFVQTKLTFSSHAPAQSMTAAAMASTGGCSVTVAALVKALGRRAIFLQ